MTEPNPDEDPGVIHIDQVLTLAADLATLGQRAQDEANAGDMETAIATLVQTFDLFTQWVQKMTDDGDGVLPA